MQILLKFKKANLGKTKIFVVLKTKNNYKKGKLTCKILLKKQI